jgi:hypothetical protein
MDRHSFTIELDNDASDYERYESGIYEAGCDDALFGMSDGKLFIDFARYAASYDAAVASAVEALKGLGAHVIKVTPITD